MSKDVLEKNVETLIESGGEPPRMDQATRAKMRAELVHRFGEAPVPRPRVRAVVLGLTATALAIFALVIGLRHRSPVVQGEALADGSTYVVDDASRVTVLGPRHVRVDGRALLDVMPGKGTFVVETAQGRVEVLGTRFVVEGGSARTLTAVIRGEVKLVSSLGSVVLHAGDQGVAEPGHPPVRSPAPRLSHLASWVHEARTKQEKTVAVHHGTLFARDPGVRSHPPWGHEYPLPLKQLTVDVTIEDQVARVALDQTFHNNAPEELEGVYRFAIPPDAALQRLAMYVDGRLEESAVVERMQARRIYEELVYRRVDPALLEWAGTGRLDLRVYPLHAQQDKRLMLAYTQSLPRLYDDWTLSVPLPEVDQPVGSLDVAVRVKGCASCELTSTSHRITVEHTGDDAVVHVHEKAVAEMDSFVLHVRDPKQTARVATHTDGGERYVLVRAPADLGAKPREYAPRTWIVLDDVSASRDATALKAQMDVIDALAKELDENDKLAVVAFDVEARTKLPPTRVLDVDRRKLRESLQGEGGVGATDFGAALDEALKLGGEGAMIVYVGDGVITAGSRHLDELRGKLAGRHFVGIGVGDGADTQTLDALATASGGYSTTIDLADDLGWRTFDLVSALHTQRVTNVAARLVDASGQLVPATGYLRSSQLADGEEIEFVGKLAGGGTPAALELTGSLDGTPWTKRVALGASHDGGYLPRLWAQRHIAARLLAKHEPAPPCAGEPCGTEDQRREARDEQIRRDVVALGKKYFLLSRHTSLLVLENDDMYKQYGVEKGSGDTWAPYGMPDHIDVPPVQITAQALPDDTEVVRAPLQIFYDYRYRTFGDVLAAEGGEDLDATGVGQGFGRRGGDLGTITLETKAKGFDPEAQRITLSGSTGLENTYFVDGHAAREHDRDDIVVTGAAGGTGNEAGDFGFAVDSTTAGWDQPIGGLVATRSAGSWRGRWNAGPAMTSPIHFTYPTDIAFDDLTAFVPALVADRFVAVRNELGHPGEHSIDDGARALLVRARAAMPTGVVRWGAFEVAIDGAHRLGWRRTTGNGLVETASFDGSTWTRRYHELDLDVMRALATDDVAFALAYMPLWIADPSHYAAYFDVKLAGNDVVLSRDGAVMYTLSFDDHAHLVAITDGDGTKLDLPKDITAQPISDAPAWALAGTKPGVALQLPIHAKPATTAPEGTPAWRAQQREAIAAAMARNDRNGAFAAFEALRTHGGVELGDLVLASGGVATATTDVQQQAALASLASEPLARYLAAARSYGKSPQPERLAPFVAGGLVGNLWALRASIAELAAGHAKQAVDRLSSITGPELRFDAASIVGSRYDLPATEVARAWKLAEQGDYANLARAQAAWTMYQHGQYEPAAEALTRMVDQLDLTAQPPQLGPYGASIMQQSRRGSAGWSIVWTKWLDTVLAGSSLPHVMALIPAATAPDDQQRLFARAADLVAGDTGATLGLARLAIAYHQFATANALVAPLLLHAPTRAAYELQGELALAQGRPADALIAFESAQDMPGNDAVPAAQLRTEMARLIRVAREVALASRGVARDSAVQKALHWGNRWRAIDPNNPAIDTQLGDLLLAVGDTQGAWRQLSGTIERDPWSSAGYMNVADAFEHEGKVEQSLPFWQQAIVIDQTNPTPRLRKAQALIALGRTAEGDELLRDIASHKWHDMWSNVVYQAKDLLGRRVQ
ncbi:MAG: FecR domain-containing protein [Deltaproteobacteria bacterium]|nr:FecR domain-containing protein [Deltaproteobacteria bacterium]